MIALYLCLTALVLAAMAAASVWLGRQIAPKTPVPMQWGFDKKPTWFAPRGRALSLAPALGTVVIVAIGLSMFPATPIARTNISHTLLWTALIFAACHALHLYLVWRWLKAEKAA